MKNWKKETTRDLMALGGIPFLILVLVRVFIASNFEIIFHIITALILLYLLSLRIKLNFHSARIVILVIFTSFFYASIAYTLFSTIIGVTALQSMKTLLKQKNINKTIILAIVCSVISFLISIPLNIPNL